MAPLGEWSLEATVLDGARGMPDTVASFNRAARRDIPCAADPPKPAAHGQRSGGLGE